MAATRKLARTRQPEALALLARDHRAIRELFRQFAALGRNQHQAQQAVVKQACDLLTVHARLEEDVFYPALRQGMKEPELLDRAEVEHGVARQLVESIEHMHADHPLLAAAFGVLSRYVLDHVREEERELFPKVRDSSIDLNALAQALRERREQLRLLRGLDQEVKPRRSGRLPRRAGAATTTHPAIH